MVGTACAPLEIGGGTACQLCYRHGSRVVPRFPQGVGVMPDFKVLGLAIWAQNPTKTQNKYYEKNE